MKKAYAHNQGIIRVVDGNSVTDKLDKGIYIPGADMQGYFLETFQTKYEFPYKIYGLEDKFIDRVIKTYENSKGNMGILLNGVKGTGKSVTAERLSNQVAEKFDMATLLITNNIAGLNKFIASITQDLIIFVDEYEKIFIDEHGNPSERDILSIMDGALKSDYRRLFIFTTNSKRIGENLLERPGRLRYIKEFSDLKREVIEEILDDVLERKEFRADCLKFMSKLNTITIDIVKAIINEVNLHGESPFEFADIFNVQLNRQKFNIYEGELTRKDMTTLLPTFGRVDSISDLYPDEMDEVEEHLNEGQYLHMYPGGRDLGQFVSLKDNILTTKTEQWNPDHTKRVFIEKKFTLEAYTPYHNNLVF